MDGAEAGVPKLKDVFGAYTGKGVGLLERKNGELCKEFNRLVDETRGKKKVLDALSSSSHRQQVALTVQLRRDRINDLERLLALWPVDHPRREQTVAELTSLLETPPTVAEQK